MQLFILDLPNLYLGSEEEILRFRTLPTNGKYQIFDLILFSR